MENIIKLLRHLHYLVFWGKTPLANGVYDYLLRLLGKNGLLLDVGCGWGALIVLEANQSREIVGVDVSPSSLRSAKRRARVFKLENVHLIACDACRLPFVNDIFDAAICTEVLEHVNNDQALLEGISSSLKVGGILVVSTPHLYWKKNIMLPMLSRILDNASRQWGHVKDGYTINQLNSLLNNAGLIPIFWGYRLKCFGRVASEIWQSVRYGFPSKSKVLNKFASPIITVLIHPFMQIGNFLDDHYLSENFVGFHLVAKALKQSDSHP